MRRVKLGQAAGSWNGAHRKSLGFCVMRRRCAAIMRSKYWFFVVVNGCRITVRSVWGRDVAVRNFRGVVGVVAGVSEW